MAVAIAERAAFHTSFHAFPASVIIELMASKPTYIKATFKTLAGVADEAAGILVANGALGCAVERGGLAGPKSRRPVILEAYFRTLRRAKLCELRRSLHAAGMLTEADPERAPQIVVDPGWATKWKSRFKPLAIGDRFLIVPPWRRIARTGRITITILPGQAFGTGHHPTTNDALLAIDDLISEHKIERGLDVGTGSGILAIAMATLKVNRVTAVDNDPLALDNARKNAALNGVSKRIRFSLAPIARMQGSFDLVVANILSKTLTAMAPDLKQLVASGGHLVLGGILAREAKVVASHYEPEFQIASTMVSRGWTTMILETAKVAR